MENQEQILSDIYMLNCFKNTALARIDERLRNGDIVPGMVSAVIWQPAKEIAKTLVSSTVGDTMRMIQESIVMPECASMRDLYIDEIIISATQKVSRILLSKPTPIQRYTTRIGLMEQDVQNLDEYNQNRVIAIGLGLPYYHFVLLVDILILYPDLFRILTYRQGSIGVGTDGSLIFTLTKKQGDEELEIPHIPGSKVETISPTNYVDIHNGVLDIGFGKGYDQIVTLPPHLLKSYETLISSPKKRQEIRNMILDARVSSCVWKNLFGRKGGKKPEKEAPMGNLSWEGRY